MLLQQLERRLDKVVYRLGFAVARRQARQLVRHGHVQVNGRKVDIPSFQVECRRRDHDPGKQPQASVFEMAKEFAAIRLLRPGLKSTARITSGRVLSLPKREDINLPINEQLIVELVQQVAEHGEYEL